MSRQWENHLHKLEFEREKTENEREKRIFYDHFEVIKSVENCNSVDDFRSNVKENAWVLDNDVSTSKQSMMISSSLQIK